MRRDVGRHAHGDAGRTVDQQVGHPGRKHRRLPLRLVIVGNEIDRLLVDVRQQFMRDARHAHLGIAHGRRGIPVDGSEVALPVHQHVAQGEGLRHAHDGVVHRGIPVGVVLADYIAYDARRFLVGLVPVVAEFTHRVERAPMHRLESVTHIRQGPTHDHAHGVIEIGLLHLVLEIDSQNFFCELGHLEETGMSLRLLCAGCVELPGCPTTGKAGDISIIASPATSEMPVCR